MNVRFRATAIILLAALASAAPTAAQFSEPALMDKPQAGYYRLKIGKVDVIAVSDGGSVSQRNDAALRCSSEARSSSQLRRNAAKREGGAVPSISAKSESGAASGRTRTCPRMRFPSVIPTRR